MSNPLPPVSSSTSTPSLSTVSRWTFHTVALISGFSVLGLLFYAIYCRYKPKTRSDRGPITYPPSPPNMHLDQPFYKQLVPRRDRQKCPHETEKLPFEPFVEGVISVSVNTILEGKTMPGLDRVTVRCFYKDKEFFVLQKPLASDSVIEFFMHNLPYEQTMILNNNRTVTLQFSLEKNNQQVFSKTFDIEVSEEKGFYRISRWGCKPRPLPFNKRLS